MVDKTKGYTAANSMRELIRDNVMLLPAISRFDIFFGFGDGTVDDVCRENGVDVGTFLCVCNLLSDYRYDISQVSLPSLMGYLKRAHTSFLDVELPKIRHHLIEAINYSSSSEAALLLIRFYDDYVEDVRRHMEYENDVIFEYVANLSKGIVDQEFNFNQYSTNHEDTSVKLKELKDIFIYHYKQKGNPRLAGTLFDIIMCERDLMKHFDVESKLLVPVVTNLENRMRNKIEHPVVVAKKREVPPSPSDVLGEREKEIIRLLAKGKINKEIADELSISVNTVATHRRNISSKLNIHSSAGLAVFAIIHHLVELDEISPI